jgi:GT2 family glycosyltransferase
MSAPAWTVVVPSSGRRPSLTQTLSALARLEPPSGGFEVVVCDDSASGLSIGGHAGVRVVRVGGRGPAAARNAGARAARGRWLAFTDDDCTPEPDWLRAFERAPAYRERAALGGPVRNAVPDNLLSVASQTVLDACHAHFNADGPSFYASSNIAVPADDYLAMGGFDESLSWAEDRAFWDSWRASGLRLGFAGGAVVWHHRSHTLADLWRQHTGYGRGAFSLHGRRGSTPRPSPEFYGRLARRAWAEPHGRRLVVLTLAALTQAATLAGYLTAARRARRASPQRVGRPHSARAAGSR